MLGDMRAKVQVTSMSTSVDRSEDSANPSAQDCCSFGEGNRSEIVGNQHDMGGRRGGGPY